MTLTDNVVLSLDSVVKRYGDFVAVDGISFDVREGEFVSFLGPSGSGKTTTLQMIAGFVDPDAGDIRLRGADLTRIPTHKRDIGVVFQNYALFPNLTVAQNVAFPLKMRRVAGPEMRRRVADALEKVQLTAFAGRKPAALSGGQQQRVALARAFVFEPKLLLMDEPLGALDKKLRELLQIEITRIARELGVTVVYVTHDQEEALAMSDRIAVYNEGRIEQLGTGPDLYRRPSSLFVATFMGDSNILSGQLRRGDGFAVDTGFGVFGGVAPAPDRLAADGETAKLVVRPEDVRIDDERSGAVALPARVTAVTYLGSSIRVHTETADGRAITSLRPAGQLRTIPAVGDAVILSWSSEQALVLADTRPATLTGLVATGVSAAG